LVTVRSHKDLIVWQKAMDLVVAVYGVAGRLPDRERYGLVSQLTRAVVSVPANIAEGHSRGTRRDYGNFLAIAQGSLAETETLLLLCERLRYLSRDDLAPILELLNEVSKMLSALRSKLNPRT
jgi:four helix bundle protein